MDLIAFTGGRIFDGWIIHHRHAVLVEGGRVAGLVPEGEIPAGARQRALEGGLLAPGFIDLQVNGGGGVMLNDGPSVERMNAILRAHRSHGTTGMLPTLITDTPAATDAAIDAAVRAVGSGNGILGLHLEGPHLAPARKGAHPADLMRPLDEATADLLIAARERIGVLLVTVAVEQAPPSMIRRLADGGVIVSLGHTDVGYDAARAAFDAGARSVTHLFNAMSQLVSRDPGMVGATLATPHVWAGIIADGHHVHPETLRAALAAKRGPGRLYLVTDAMASVGMEGDSFQLHGRTVYRQDGRLTLPGGTLAGADVDMASCVRYAAHSLGLGIEEALRMASLYPAEVIGDASRGRITKGSRAEFVLLDDDMQVLDVLTF